jgi:carboxyl-terminal processing protease
MSIHNTKKTILQPLLLALLLAAGIIIGNLLNRFGEDNRSQDPVVKKLNSIINFIESEYVDTISKGTIIEKALPQILNELDPHSQYIPARELQALNEPLEGNFEGIGVQFNIQEDTVMVVGIVHGGPSEKKGILPGDRIVKVNDTSIAGVKITNAMVMKKLKGKKGTHVKLGIRRSMVKDLLTFEIERDQVPILSVDVSFMMKDNIGYIKISKFSKTTHFEFKKAAMRLRKQGMNKMILDLRGNGGGYLDAAVNLADEFLDAKKLIVYTQGKARPKTCYNATSKGFCQDIMLVVLIDELSASASEIFAGAIQDNDRGYVVGRRSFGKGLVQEPVVFSDGSELRLTVARYYTPTGRCIQKPYKHGVGEYDNDLEERYLKGEFEKADSIKFNDSLKFKTPGGRVVYGGGGIMPDIFVPLDTSGYIPYLNIVINRGLVNKFAFQYTDKNRKKLSLLTNVKALESYLESQNLINDFMIFAAKNNIPANPQVNTMSKSGFILKTQLKAYIARNILDDNGFYPIIFKADNTIQNALSYFEKQKK